jgi:hypothetical protein
VIEFSITFGHQEKHLLRAFQKHITCQKKLSLTLDCHSWQVDFLQLVEKNICELFEKI